MTITKISFLFLVIVFTAFAHSQERLRPTSCIKQEQLEARIETIKANKVIFERHRAENKDPMQNIRLLSESFKFDDAIRKTEEELVLVKNDCAIDSLKK